MNIVLTFSTKDQHLMPKLARVLTAFGPYNAHLVLAHSSPVYVSGQALLTQLEETLKGSFESIRRFDTGPEMGWPLGANTAFLKCAIDYGVSDLDGPWFFMEADNVPMKKEWFTELTTQYHLSSKFYMGGSRNLRVNSRTEPYMVGSAFYPKDLLKKIPFLTACGVTAFDVFARFEFLKEGSLTDSILVNWRSHNYRREDTLLVCSGQDSLSDVSAVQEKHLIVHGCKDESLLDLVLESLSPKKKAKVTVVECPQTVLQDPAEKVYMEENEKNFSLNSNGGEKVKRPRRSKL